MIYKLALSNLQTQETDQKYQLSPPNLGKDTYEKSKLFKIILSDNNNNNNSRWIIFPFLFL